MGSNCSTSVGFGDDPNPLPNKKNKKNKFKYSRHDVSQLSLMFSPLMKQVPSVPSKYISHLNRSFEFHFERNLFCFKNVLRSHLAESHSFDIVLRQKHYNRKTSNGLSLVYIMKNIFSSEILYFEFVYTKSGIKLLRIMWFFFIASVDLVHCRSCLSFSWI